MEAFYSISKKESKVFSKFKEVSKRFNALVWLQFFDVTVFIG